MPICVHSRHPEHRFSNGMLEFHCAYMAQVVFVWSLYFFHHRKLLLTIRFGGDLLVADFWNYFPFSWSLQTIHKRACVLLKRIPDWKSIRRIKVECWMDAIYIYTFTGRLHCAVSFFGFGMKWFRQPFQFLALQKRENILQFTNLFSTLAASTINTIFQSLSSWSATTLLRCENRLSSAALRELSTNEKLRKEEWKKKLFKLMLK